MYSRSNNNLLFRLTSLALVLWLSGAVCLLSCQRHVQAGALADSPLAVESFAHAHHHAMPQASSSGHGCCHRAKTVGEERGPDSLSRPVSLAPQVNFCCNFTGQMASAALRPTVKQDSAPPLAYARQPSFYGSMVRAAQTFGRPPPLDRSETQLRDCVFLI